MPVIPGAQQSHINFIPIDTTPSPWTLTNWYVTSRSPQTDFTQSIEDMLLSYLYNNWGTPIAISPFKSINPPADFNSKVRFGDWEYDYFSTYYIRVKEEDTAIDNDLIINGGCFLMKTAVNIDLTARRLTYGEHFEEMNNMRLEVSRILANYRPDQISGIHAIDIETPGERDIETRNFERAGRLQKTIWYLRIKAVCHYIKAWACVPPAT
jgi:hypothetical protein